MLLILSLSQIFRTPKAQLDLWPPVPYGLKQAAGPALAGSKKAKNKHKKPQKIHFSDILM